MQGRLVTVVGPAGLGKTTVAAATVGSLPPEYREHVLWCRCDLWPHVRDRLEREVLPVLRRAFSNRAKLLVLDSLEVAIDSEAKSSITDAIAALCGETPELRVLATSLIPLNVPGEQQYPLQPLASVPVDEIVPMEDLTTYPAVQLLVDRVRDVRPDYRIGPDDDEPICTIARALGGHPLALELVGQPVAWRGAAVVAQDLAANRSPAERDQGPERHRSLATIVAYSLATLNPTDRQILILICALGPASWSLLQGVAADLGIDLATLDASFHTLELRRLASRMDHLVMGPHAIIRRQLRINDAQSHEFAGAERSAIIVMSGWYQQEAPAPHLCTCTVCAELDDMIAERYVTVPESLIGPAPIELLHLGLNWTRTQVAAEALVASSAWENDQPDGVSLLDGVLAATAASDSEEAIPLQFQIANWLIEDRDHEKGWLRRVLELADHLHVTGHDDLAVEVLENCAEGSYDAFGAHAWDGDEDIFQEGRGVLVRLMRCAKEPAHASERSRACLQYLRWLLDFGEVGEAEWRKGLRKARTVSRRARVWAESVGDESGKFEAILSERIISYHLDPRSEVANIQTILEESVVGDEVNQRPPMGPAGQGEIERLNQLVADDPKRWEWFRAASERLFRRALRHMDHALVDFWSDCVESAEESVGRELWTSAAEWAGYAERCGCEDSETVDFEARVSVVRKEIEAHLGRGATTVAISEARAASPDVILRRLGYWLPGDPGYAEGGQ